MPPPMARPSYRRAIAIALFLCVAFLIGLEAATRLGFQRVSRIEGRIASEYVAAKGIGATLSGQPPSILLLGNSLLLEALEYDTIQKTVAPEARLTRFVIEQTHYLDWHYGIRRLLAEGARPDIMVLCLAPSHMIDSLTRGDYSSYYLFQMRDIAAVAGDAGYDLTRESSLVAAHYSLFYAGRAGLRGYLLNRVDAPYADILHQFAFRPARLPPGKEIERIVEERLRRLKDSVQGRTRIVLLLPPGFMAGEQEMREAAERTGITMLTPVHTGELPQSMFRDDFHVNEIGATKFTAALAPPLKELAVSTKK